MSFNFQTTTHGKWILTGEHAVLRGQGALVFPIRERKFILSYKKTELELSINYEGVSGQEMHLLLEPVLKEGLRLVQPSQTILRGHFHLYSDIPIGVGMGASAALSVAVARWFDDQNLLDESVFSFARNLEHLFHGKSSGLDIAGVSTETGVYFQQGNINPIQQRWAPQWYLSYCGEIGLTSQCITKVQDLWKNDPKKAVQVDNEMNESVNKARVALEQDTVDSLKLLTEAVEQAAHCFRQWGLINKTLQQHMQMLSDLGALAVKPTGSGGGGFVLSLWDKTPPEMSVELIAV